MIKATWTALITVFLTVFMTPAAQIAYSWLEKPTTKRSTPKKSHVTSIHSSVLKNLRGLVWGAEYSFTDEEAIVCIVGEASGESWEGQVAIGEAIRNRGHLKGVYGCTAKRVHSEPKWVWDKAKLCWEASVDTNLTKGADHWHSDLEKPAWWEKHGVFTTKIGHHKFYKEVYR